ncbi:OmpW family protein [Pseudomonas sp. 17104299]|uniref:OmpW/AlkL family protein n=1 Tax=Pseudomonas sp. 17104299 TaxID=2952239 RepID=UPI0021582C7F|nr:OmpW family outer membrane protein [Pseudomonas sp. 17104299]
MLISDKKTSYTILLSLTALLASHYAEASTSENPNHIATLSPNNETRWFVRVGPLWVPYHSGANIEINGVSIPGATAHARNNVTAMFDVGYEFTQNFSIMIMGGIPPRTAVNGGGTVESLGNLGSVRYGPIFVTGIYHLPQWHALSPYVGAGLAHAFILKDYDGAVSHLKVHSGSGTVIQTGIEYQWSKKWKLFVDYKHLWLHLNAHGSLQNTPVKARITLDPDLVSMGVKFQF